MPIHQETIVVATQGAGGIQADGEVHGCFVDLTGAVSRVVGRSNILSGLATVFIQHTSASLIIQENADPRVLHDLDRWMRQIAPVSQKYSHNDEGPDDMPGHLRAAITKTSETVPIVEGRLGLGTWQAIYLWEHRTRHHQRSVVVTVVGDS